MSSEVIKLTDETFDEVLLQDDLPTLVDFWAEWCPPCHAIAPVIEGLAADYAGRVRVGKLNVDENPETASRFSILSIPTLLVFQGGEILEHMVGAQPKGTIKASLDKVLNNSNQPIKG
jgi:thioredoxin 1